MFSIYGPKQIVWGFYLLYTILYLIFIKRQTMNPIHKKIYDIICEDIDKNPKGFSTITNAEISKDINISPYSVRDHVILLVKRGHLQKINNHWTEENEFYNRILFRGKNTPKHEPMDSE